MCKKLTHILIILFVWFLFLKNTPISSFLYLSPQKNTNKRTCEIPRAAQQTLFSLYLQMSGKTAIQYYIPEDGDDLEHPNILLIEKEASKITLGDIRKV